MQKIIGLIVAGLILIAGAYFIFDSIKDIKSAPAVLESTTTDLMNKVDGAMEKMEKVDDAMEKVDGAMEKIDGAMEKTEGALDGVMEKAGDVMEKTDDAIDGAMEKVGDTMEKHDGTDTMVKTISEEITLTAVGARGGDAQAARILKDGVFTHFVTVNNVDPAAGKFFEGWLTTESDFISTGKMTKDEAGMWRLQYTSNDDRLMYNRVVVTEETESMGLDNKPETHIFEGAF